MKLLERFATRQAARMMLCYIIISAIVGGTVGVITALGIRYFCDIDISIYIMVFAGVVIALIAGKRKKQRKPLKSSSSIDSERQQRGQPHRVEGHRRREAGSAEVHQPVAGVRQDRRGFHHEQLGL